MIRRFASTLLLVTAAALLAACATAPQPPCPACPAPEVPKPAEPLPPKARLFEPAAFSDLPGWNSDDPGGTLETFRASCARLRTQPAWQSVCAAAVSATPGGAREFFERHLAPWRVSAADGQTSGLVTGYYEPLLRGSRTRQGRYQVPLHAPPDDLLIIDLAAVNPDLKNMRLRGRLEGRRVVPYYSRAEIERGAGVRSKELVWVDDAVEAFFLQIQGSGRVQLDSGETVRIGYADQNGHPYVPIGRVLIERGALQPNEASMQGIQAWARSHPQELPELLNNNPSYVFFRELPPPARPDLGPPGAIGVPLTPMRSVAVDPRFIPLGAPLFLATTWPLSDEPLERMVFAQDTGGAIRGAVRADFFWGFGPEAGERAGRMRQQGRMWLLWPKGAEPPGR
jgi:membrane-bound lytic murein transglycosylase A